MEGWLDSEWDEAKGIFKLKHGPYSDAFEYHYVAAVLLNTPDSRLHGNQTLRKRVIADLLYHSKVFVEQCKDKGLRGYWALNSASDKGVPVGSGSWQSRSYIRACQLLDGGMTAEQRQAWRDGARWLIAALTVDWKETYGPWWSTNKVADHVAGAAAWLHVSGEEPARQFLDRQFDWYWRAFPEEGFADKYHNYFAKTLYRLAPVLLVPEAKRYHQPLLERVRVWRSFITPNGFYDAALHGQPNDEETWRGKLGPVLALLLLAAPHDPELALVARNIADKRLADWKTEEFWKRKFDPYFGLHWGSLGLILESAPAWQKAAAGLGAGGPASFDQLRFFDYWKGLGRVAVKTDRYQASCYMHWAWTWDFALLGGTLYRLNTPGDYRFIDRVQAAPRKFQEIGRRETARCWLDWDPHRDPETGRQRTGMVVAKTGDSTLSLPPDFPDEAVVSGLPEGRLFGFTHCRYRLGDGLEVRTSNVFLRDAVVVLNTVTALKDVAFDDLYLQQSLANPGELTAVAAGGKTIEFEAENAKPAPSVSHPVEGPLEFRSKGGTGSLGFRLLASSVKSQELVDISLYGALAADEKKTPHRVEYWRGHLPANLRKGEVLVGDFLYVPRDGEAPTMPAAEVIRSAAAHGVILPGDSGVVIAQSMAADGSAQAAGGDFRAAGQLLAVEMAGGKVRKACLYGRSLLRGSEAILTLSRPAAATILPERGEGIADTGPGPLTVIVLDKSLGLFSTNHEFPRVACTSQKLPAAAAAEASPRAFADIQAACRRFAALPGRIEVAAHLAELDLLRQAAEARGMKTDALVMGRARETLAAGDPAQAASAVGEARKTAIALHEAADRAGRAVAAVSGKDAAAVGLPPEMSGQERMPQNYLISFAEEKARDAVIRRAEALCRAAVGKPDCEGLCAAVRDAETVLLTRYFGLPIRWTRQHIPGQPDFFWRPILAGQNVQPPEGAGDGRIDPASLRQAPSEWERSLLKYIQATDRIWLALHRLEAAARLIAE